MSQNDLCLDWCRDACPDHYSKNQHGQQPPCGCGQGHRMMPFSEQIVHYQGQHWVLDCLAKKLLHDHDKDRQALGLIIARMKAAVNVIANLKCATPTCSNKVGKRFKIIGNQALCVTCFFGHDIGCSG